MAASLEWLVQGGQVVSPGGLRRADVGIVDGEVAEVAEDIDPSRARNVVDATGRLVFPGIIDAHNHAYYDDDIESYSLSAAFGGITSLVSFAGRPWGTTGGSQSAVDVVEDFVADGENRSYLDFGVQAILSPDDIPGAIDGLFERGVAAYKVFMAFPGNRMVDDGKILELMERVAALGGLCMVHCENGHATHYLEQRLRGEGRVTAADYVDSRPPQLETEAVHRALALAELAGCDCYIVHVSAAASLDVVEAFRAHGGPARYAETCPHYLVFDRHDQERLGRIAKISPPMRDAGDVEGLWAAVARGAVDVVASDCSGQTLETKARGDSNFFDAAFGLPGVEQLFPVVYDEAVNKRGLDPAILARAFCERPAEIFGLAGKGRLEPGFDGDLVVFDPEARWTVRAAEQHGNSDYSIYEGRELRGRAVFSLLRGQPLLQDGKVVVPPGTGRYLRAERPVAHGSRS
jgi:dihydroorotase-like cyclic amidohydrolase